jgi:hypothetical protein
MPVIKSESLILAREVSELVHKSLEKNKEIFYQHVSVVFNQDAFLFHDEYKFKLAWVMKTQGKDNISVYLASRDECDCYGFQMFPSQRLSRHYVLPLEAKAKAAQLISIFLLTGNKIPNA